ncbi:4Fe-4S binding protein [Luteolibacter marinus]|uniref:4Fe-4S binding protein n=1 Tax=Luteolibacter marinus TaxID=2776705 RepID=UPI001868FBB2|nr:4Fe-4S binding protein [Luteolibacter marinus]
MKTRRPRADPGRRARRWLIAGYRLGVLAAVFLCLHRVHVSRMERRSGDLDPAQVLAQVQSFLPAAATIGSPSGDDRLLPVLDAAGEPVGWVAQTFPESGPITGYAGPSNLLVVFDNDRRVAGVGLVGSADTAGHVAKVMADGGFVNQWTSRSQASLGAPSEPVIVSGASQTSEAMARGLAARFGASGMDRWFPEGIDLETIRPCFPAAAGVQGTRVVAADGRMLGTVLRSVDMGVAVRGFQGIQDVLVCLDPEEKTIVGVFLAGSRDNPPYTRDVGDALKFEAPFAGMPVADVAALETGSTVMVSGASRTAEAVEDTVKEMLRRHFAPPLAPPDPFGWREAIALSWIVAGLVIGLGPLRGRPRVRAGFAVVSVVAGGLWLGLMTGQDQWIKSAMRGSVAGVAIPLLALTAAAIVIPAIFGKNVYCSQLCPHGAAQQWMGKLTTRRIALPRKLHRVLLAMPWTTLGALWLLAFLGLSIPFADAEPFEVWSTGFIAMVPVAIFLAGLALATVLPQAYCHYGCPTGAVLKFLTSAPGRWTRRDAIAGGVVLIAWLTRIFA